MDRVRREDPEMIFEKSGSKYEQVVYKFTFCIIRVFSCQSCKSD